MSPDAIGFVNGFCGEALGTSAALCTVYSRCVTSPILRRGDRVIHFALQALQLHATPANPSPHTPRVKFKFKFKFKFMNLNASGPPPGIDLYRSDWAPGSLLHRLIREIRHPSCAVVDAAPLAASVVACCRVRRRPRAGPFASPPWRVPSPPVAARHSSPSLGSRRRRP